MKTYIVTRDCTMSCQVEAESEEAAINLACHEGKWATDENYYDVADCYITNEDDQD